MPLRPLTLPIESAPGRYGQDGDPRLINVYAEKRGDKDKAGKDLFAHYAAAGLSEWTTIASGGGCRGLFKVDAAQLIAVSGQAVVSIDPFGAVTFLGGLLGSRNVFFARNTRSPYPQIVIIGDSQKKVIENGVLTDITDPDLQPANSADFISSYVLFGHSSGRFSFSAINDATSIAALDFFTAEGKPDGLRRLKVFGNQVWLFGEETTEIWGLTDDAQRPFQRLQGAYLDLGCIAPSSVVQIGQRMAWVAHDKTVRIAAGYDTTVVSSHAVADAIRALPDPSVIEANVVMARGHQMLRLNSPAWTWVYDATDGYGMWHEERSVGSNRRRAAHSADFAGKTLTGDVALPKLYAWDDDLGRDGPAPLMCTLRSRPQHVYPGEVEFNALYVDVISGSGLNTPSDPVTLDPVLVMRDSDDGGATWSNPIEMPIGRLGERAKRLHAHQLGTSGEDGRMFEFTWDAAANKAVIGAVVDAEAIAP